MPKFVNRPVFQPVSVGDQPHVSSLMWQPVSWATSQALVFVRNTRKPDSGPRTPRAGWGSVHVRHVGEAMQGWAFFWTSGRNVELIPATFGQAPCGLRSDGRTAKGRKY